MSASTPWLVYEMNQSDYNQCNWQAVDDSTPRFNGGIVLADLQNKLLECITAGAYAVPIV